MDIQFDRITTGIEKYIRLMKWVHETNVSEDSVLQRILSNEAKTLSVLRLLLSVS